MKFMLTLPKVFIGRLPEVNLILKNVCIFINVKIIKMSCNYRQCRETHSNAVFDNRSEVTLFCAVIVRGSLVV